MKTFYNNKYQFIKQMPCWLVLFILIFAQTTFGQPATVSNPLAMGAKNCNGGGTNSIQSFSYDSVTRKLTSISSCTPSLGAPGFNALGGSIAFSPKDQKLYYIETTTGNNSIVWNWTPGTCPTGGLAPLYTYASTFIVGLEFDIKTGDGYQLEFSTGSAPYTIYLRKVTSFGPPLVAGASIPINLGGKNIYQQNGDIAITPNGLMYLALDNKMFKLDYSTYSAGYLNATFIDTLMNGAGNNVIGLSYINGNFVASVQGTSCSYKQLDITTTTGAINSQTATLASGSFTAFDMASVITGIGASKKLTTLSKTGTTTYQATYDIKIKNYGNVDLNSVQLKDSVKTAFGASFVSASVAAVGSLPSGLTINPLFNGNTVPLTTGVNIFTTGGTMKASPTDSAIVRVTVNLLNPNLSTTYYNSAIATATGGIFSNAVRDSSDNQTTLNPDVSGTDVPDAKGQGVPTPITPALWLLLDNNIINFNANRSGDLVNIIWKIDNQATGTTTVLQRSADGINFDNIAVLDSKSLSSQEYNWQDVHPLASNNYYRLQISSPGSSKIYSGVVLIRKTEVPVVVTVSPNPFMQSLKFTMNLDKAARINYRILDYVSTVLQTGQSDGHAGQNEVDLYNLGNIPAGANILEVVVGDKHYFQKLIKLK
ncbi:MAG: hypothetical protein ABJB86_15550 [Bacteroidota bacterium]